MTDKPTNRTDSVRPENSRPQSSGSSNRGSSSTAPSGPTLDDPKRFSYGDKTDEANKRPDQSRSGKGNSPRLDDDTDDDAGEGHKGPRGGTTSMPADNRMQSDRANPTSQVNQQPKSGPQKSPRQDDDTGTDSESITYGKESKDKSARGHSSGRTSE